jgi:hypothetical protein
MTPPKNEGPQLERRTIIDISVTTYVTIGGALATGPVIGEAKRK